MIYSKYNIGIILRVLAILGLTIFLSYILVTTNWFFTPLVTFSVLVIVVFELIHHLHRQQRELNNFLIAVKQGGFNTSFPEGGSFKTIFRTFNEIIRSFQELALEKESNYQFLLLLTENIRAGLICFDQKGTITMLNPAAKLIIGKPYLNSFSELERIEPKLYDCLSQLPSGQSRVIKMKIDRVMQDILVYKKKMVIEKNNITILLLQNIREQIDSNELESWQKLTRVMRHEIMNSLTPIVGLSEAIHTVLKQKKSISPSEETYQDIQESMEAISSRSKALLQFVNAYKHFSDTPELQKSTFDASEMIQRVDQLLKKDFERKNITTRLPAEGILIHADEQLLEGVVLNLMKNALEAVENKGRIDVSVNNKDNAKISISDNGPGLSDEQLDQIFIPFYTTKTEGSGIGLSLARKVVQLHGGKIDAYNNANGGLTVEIILQSEEAVLDAESIDPA